MRNQPFRSIASVRFRPRRLAQSWLPSVGILVLTLLTIAAQLGLERASHETLDYTGDIARVRSSLISSWVAASDLAQQPRNPALVTAVVENADRLHLAAVKLDSGIDDTLAGSTTAPLFRAVTDVEIGLRHLSRTAPRADTAVIERDLLELDASLNTARIELLHVDGELFEHSEAQHEQSLVGEVAVTLVAGLLMIALTLRTMRAQGQALDLAASQEVLRRSEERFRALIQNTSDIISVYDRDGTLRYLSPAFDQALGYAGADWLNRNALELCHPDDRLRLGLGFRQALRHPGQTRDLVIRLRHADGSWRWFEVKAQASEDDTVIDGVVGAARDITDRKSAEAALLAGERRYRTLIERIPAVTYIDLEDPSDPAGFRFIYVSPQVTALTGYLPEEWIASSSPLDYVHPDDRQRMVQVSAETVNGAPFECEYRLVTRDGRVVWIYDQASVLETDANGRQLWQGVMIDITKEKEAAAALVEAELRYRTLVEEVPVASYQLKVNTADRADRRFLYVSPQIEHLLGIPVDVWMADLKIWDQRVHPDDYGRVVHQYATTSASTGLRDVSYRIKKVTGEWVWWREVGRRISVDADGYARWQGVILDITAQMEAQLALREREAELSLLFARNPQPTWVYDRETLRFLEVNPAACALYGYDRETFLSLRIDSLSPAGLPVDPHLIREDLSNLDVPRQLQHVTAEGRAIAVEVTAHPLEYRKRDACLVIAQDVTARNALEARLVHQAFNDALTGLPNRALFAERLDDALQRDNSVAVLFVDLDDFKVVNDTLGHEVGDALLLAVGERLQIAIRPTDTIARLGGDEFTVLLNGATLEEAIAVADRLIQLLSEPFHLADHELTVSPSIGIARNDIGAERPEELLRRADIAMYEAKQGGKRRHATFSPRMDEHSWQRLHLESDLRKAIAGDGLELAFQPIVELSSGQVRKLEALVRWTHPTRGLLYPGEFIGIAEQSDLILDLDRWVLREAARRAQTWSVEGLFDHPVRVAVNLSARQFRGGSYVDVVASTLRDTGLDPSLLMLEITETVAVSDIPRTLSMLNELKELGVLLAIDDFGSGYSGLTYLQRSPFDVIKIDRSYIDGIVDNPRDLAMVRAVLAFARSFDIAVTAEGVENVLQLGELRELGVDFGQGYYFGRPQPLDELLPAIRAGLGFGLTGARAAA